MGRREVFPHLLEPTDVPLCSGCRTSREAAASPSAARPTADADGTGIAIFNITGSSNGRGSLLYLGMRPIGHRPETSRTAVNWTESRHPVATLTSGLVRHFPKENQRGAPNSASFPFPVTF
jgi:hypothetical protein